MNNSNEHPFSTLTPDLVIDAIESTGLLSDLRIYPLNSYENRVYQIGIEDSAPIIAKFYRPERWSDEQILEEHQFALALSDQEIPVVPPMKNIEGETLYRHNNFRFSLYERKGGHAPELSDLDSLLTLGRLIGRIHAVGAQTPFTHRPSLNLQNFGEDSVAFILANMIPNELRPAYESLSRDLLEKMKTIFSEFNANTIRVHGDCHIGNILWRDEAPHFVDLDDARNAPAAQDIWMFLNGDRQQQTIQLAELLEGYQEFHDFNLRELHLFEALRTLRLMHHSAWLARRWEDPAFPRNFPWFNSMKYWSEHILSLREQLAALDEPALKYMG